MTDKEIIEKKMALVQNDIDHYQREFAKLCDRINMLEKEKESVRRRISRKDIYKAQLARDIENLKS